MPATRWTARHANGWSHAQVHLLPCLALGLSAHHTGALVFLTMMRLTCLACTLRGVFRPAAAHPEARFLDVVSHKKQAAASRWAGRQGQPSGKANTLKACSWHLAFLPPPHCRSPGASHESQQLLASSKWLRMCGTYPVGGGGGGAGLGGGGLRSAGEEARWPGGEVVRWQD